MFRQSWLALLPIVLSVMCGCGGESFKIYPVSGSITFEGEPMAGGGSIAFIPIGESSDKRGKAPGGSIDDSGNYILSTNAENDGSMVGEYRVVIVQETVEEPEATPDGTAPAESTSALPEKLIIPAIYADFNASPLKATVEAKTNEINFELKRQANPAPVSPTNTGA